MTRYIFVIAFLAFGPGGVLGQELRVPRFEKADCAIEIPKGERVVCGNLVVSENRAAKSTRAIRLPVIILKSDNPNPKVDPVLRTLGGPGSSSLKLVRGRRASPWLRERDYIIFEQRGTKYAAPSLQCPEVDEANIRSVKDKLERKVARRHEIDAAKTCRERLIKSGVDLNGFNSSESAADIEDLRKTLRIEKLNLYGVSYSARLMLDVVRYFPGGIRSVVLESTLPPEVNYDEVGVDGIVRTLDRMFAACQADTDCAAAYPKLEDTFYRVVRTLNANPITSTVNDGSGNSVDVRLNGDDFVTWIIDYLFSNEPSATIEAPYVTALADKGNFDAFKRYASDKVNPSSNSWGMRYSVWCSEEIPFENGARIRGQSKKFKGLNGYEVMALPDICSVWKVKRSASESNTVVKSDIPSLVLTAEYDAYTPPEWGRQTAANLSRSFYFEIPWAGHGPAFSVPCVAVMIAGFIDQPTVRPAGTCVDQTRLRFKFRTK